MKPVLRFLKAELTMGAIVAAAGTALIGFADLAAAQERVRLKLASSYSSTSDVLGENITRLIDNIKVMSVIFGGRGKSIFRHRQPPEDTQAQEQSAPHQEWNPIIDIPEPDENRDSE